MIESASVDVRFAPESDRLLRCHKTPLWANNGLTHCSKSGGIQRGKLPNPNIDRR